MKKLLCLAPLALVVLGALAGCSKSREHLNPYDASGPDLKYVKPWTAGTWRAGEYRDDAIMPVAQYHTNPGSTNESLYAFTGFSSNHGVALLSFDTSDFPANSRLLKATLVFDTSCGDFNYKISKLNGPFDGTTVWATVPTATYITSYFSQMPASGCPPYARVDITSTYQAWLDGSANYGLLFENGSGLSATGLITSVSLEITYHLK